MNLVSNGKGHVILVDVLDLWSMPKVIFHSHRGQVVRYLIFVGGWQRKIISIVLSLLGRLLARQPSYFENEEPGFYQEYSRLALEYQLKYVEPLLTRHIATQSDLPSDEVARLARYATVQAWGFSSRAFELLLSARRSQPDIKPSLLFQSSICDDALRRYATEQHCVTAAYHAPGRLLFPVRADYYSDHGRITPSLFSTVAFAGAIFTLGVKEWITTALRVAVSSRDDRNAEERYDVLALAYQDTPLPGFNDLFWAEALRQLGSYRVFAVHTRPLSKAARKFYLLKADRLDSLEDYVRLASLGRSLLAPRSVSLCHKNELGLLIRKAFKQIIWRSTPIWLTTTLFRVEKSASLIGALMKTSGARVTWAMLEGNDLTSLAMTLAAGRVGGTCFGTTWSMPYSARIYDAIARNHVFFVWGARQNEIYIASNALPRRYVATGYPTILHYLSKGQLSGLYPNYPDWLRDALASSSRQRIVTFFDNVCGNDLIITCAKLLDLLQTLLDWLEKRSEVLLVIKTKRIGNPVLSGRLGARINSLVQQGTIHVREEKADVQAGLVADVVVGISSATLALLAAAYGRNCVLYDQHDVMSEDTFPAGLRTIRKVSLLSELPLALDDALTKSADTGERRGTIDEYADAQGCARVAHYISEVLEAHRRGLTGVQAEEMAFRKYEERWARQLSRL